MDQLIYDVEFMGFVGDNDREAKKTYLEHEIKMFQTGSAESYCNCSIFVYSCSNYLIINYFPIQNFEKILSSRSSVVIVPVISPR